MTILDVLKAQATFHAKNVAIGLGDDLESNHRIYKGAMKVIQNTASQIIFVGHPDSVNRLTQILKNVDVPIEFCPVSDPSTSLVQALFTNQPLKTTNNQERKIDAIIRGGVSSATFLKVIRGYKENLMKLYPTLELPTFSYRLALLETADKQQFFFAPVGIDEANTYVDKKKLLTESINFCNRMKIEPKIGILSGGRLSDVGRDPWVDQTIEEAENLTKNLQKEYPHVPIQHYQIMIENAIQDHANIILAPEGIAGNLIYRTLVHLGAGKSYGAIYLSHYNLLNKIIIDTSRVAPEFEIEGAFYFAMGLK